MRTLILIAAAAAGAFAQNAPVNLDFEAGTTGWHVSTGGGAAVADRGCLQGRTCVLLTGAQSNLYEMVTPNPYLSWLDRLRASLRPSAGSRHMRFRAAVRVEGRDTGVRLWVRVERKGGSTTYQDSPAIAASGWNYYQVAANLDPDVVRVSFGFLLSGSGKAWLDDASFAATPAVRQTPRRSTQRILWA